MTNLLFAQRYPEQYENIGFVHSWCQSMLPIAARREVKKQNRVTLAASGRQRARMICYNRAYVLASAT